MFRDDRYKRNKIGVNVPAHLNYGKYILDRIRKQPKDNIALINGKKAIKITYGELTQYAVDLAVGLVQFKTGPGDVVAVCSESRDETLGIFIGVMLSGASYTPMDLNVGRANLKHNLKLTKPKHVIFSQMFWNDYKDILKNFNFNKYIVIDDIGVDVESAVSIENLTPIRHNVKNFEPANVNGQQDVALILYSSGSTGYPKGIMKTHLSCISNSLIKSFEDPALKTSICYGNWSHSYDLHMTLKFLTSGRTVVYFEGDINVFLNCVQNYKANIAFLYPSFIHEFNTKENLQQYNLNSLQSVYCGTSALLDDLKIEFVKRLPNLKTFIKGYGMTETFELTSECWGVPGLKQNTVGKPGLNITLKVIDLSTEEPLGPNKVGELRVEAYNIFKGYIGIDPLTYLDKEGFLKTGDMGYFDEDGYFYIIDRIKQVISYDGYKVSPMEIEKLLYKYPGVKDAAVIGKPVPKYGEEPLAFIVTEAGYNLTEKEIIDYINYEGAYHMKLRGGVMFVDKIPRNSIGKIIRPELQKMQSF